MKPTQIAQAKVLIDAHQKLTIDLKTLQATPLSDLTIYDQERERVIFGLAGEDYQALCEAMRKRISEIEKQLETL